MHPIEHIVFASPFLHLVLRIVHKSNRDVLIKEEQYHCHQGRKCGGPASPDGEITEWDTPYVYKLK